MRDSNLTAERLRELLDYNPDTGAFIWREHGTGKPADLRAGRVNSRGYAQISIGYRKYAAHRLAWLYVHGVWPPEDIDHRNQNRSDNRIDNLRPASELQNTWNRATPSNNKCGLKGVYLASPNRWRSQIKVNGKRVVLGHFDDKESAHAAYRDAAMKLRGEFASA